LTIVDDLTLRTPAHAPMALVDTLLAYVAACLLVVPSPSPNNIPAISRGLSRGRLARGSASHLSALTLKQRSAP
jgi:hypothetical protein